MNNLYPYTCSTNATHANTVGGRKWKIPRRTVRPIILLLSLLFVFHTSTSLQAQQATDYAVHANIIYRFTKYVDWPDEKKSGHFIIGVTGETPLYEELILSMINKKVGNQKIIIKKFSATDATFNCHILFISEEESGNIKKISSRTAGTAVLLVSESDGLAQKGSCINFVIAADRLKLEINKVNVEGRQLSIAPELLQLGKIVK